MVTKNPRSCVSSLARSDDFEGPVIPFSEFIIDSLRLRTFVRIFLNSMIVNMNTFMIQMIIANVRLLLIDQ